MADTSSVERGRSTASGVPSRVQTPCAAAAASSPVSTAPSLRDDRSVSIRSVFASSHLDIAKARPGTRPRTPASPLSLACGPPSSGMDPCRGSDVAVALLDRLVAVAGENHLRDLAEAPGDVVQVEHPDHVEPLARPV